MKHSLPVIRRTCIHGVGNQTKANEMSFLTDVMKLTNIVLFTLRFEKIPPHAGKALHSKKKNLFLVSIA